MGSDVTQAQPALPALHPEGAEPGTDPSLEDVSSPLDGSNRC